MLEGGVNGRKPSRLAEEPGLRCSLLAEPIFLEPELSKLWFAEFAEFSEERVLLLVGGVNGRIPPRFPFAADDWPTEVRFPKLPDSRLDPALGFSTVPIALGRSVVLPLEPKPADSRPPNSPLVRPPAGMPET